MISIINDAIRNERFFTFFLLFNYSLPKSRLLYVRNTINLSRTFLSGVSGVLLCCSRHYYYLCCSCHHLPSNNYSIYVPDIYDRRINQELKRWKYVINVIFIHTIYLICTDLHMKIVKGFNLISLPFRLGLLCAIDAWPISSSILINFFQLMRLLEHVGHESVLMLLHFAKSYLL